MTCASWAAQEDASEFLEETKLKELVAKYSEFINFPIYLWGCAPFCCGVSETLQRPFAPTMQQGFS